MASIETFPVNISEVHVPSNKPVFSLDEVTRSALSIDPIFIDNNEPVMQFNTVVQAPQTNTIPLVNTSVVKTAIKPRNNIVTMEAASSTVRHAPQSRAPPSIPASPIYNPAMIQKYQKANTIKSPDNPEIRLVKIPTPSSAQITENAMTIFADVAKIATKSYTPQELFSKYPNHITGTQSEWFTRTKNKSFVRINILLPKNAADVKLIMDGERVVNEKISLRLRNSR